MPKISQIDTASTPLSGRETFILNQNGTTYTASLSDISEYAGGGSDVSSLSGNWQNTYTTYASNSASYAKTNVDNNFTTRQRFTSGNITLGTLTLSGYTNYDNIFYVSSGTNHIGLSAGSGSSSSMGSNYMGGEAGLGALFGAYSNFMGYRSGYTTNGAQYSNFIGYSAGYDADNSEYSNFIGFGAGYEANDSPNCNFIGSNSGFGGSSVTVSNFIGVNSGYEATNASNCNFIGYNAGYGAINAINCNFIGTDSGYSALSPNDCNYIGYKSGEFNTGDRNQCIGSNSSALYHSDCIVIGHDAIATQSNSFVLGSTTSPLLTASTGTNTGLYLIVILNGRELKIPLYK